MELREKEVPIRAIFGLLWNCDDILPRGDQDHVCGLCPEGQEPRAQTYGAAVRALKGLIVP